MFVDVEVLQGLDIVLHTLDDLGLRHTVHHMVGIELVIFDEDDIILPVQVVAELYAQAVAAQHDDASQVTVLLATGKTHDIGLVGKGDEIDQVFVLHHIVASRDDQVFVTPDGCHVKRFVVHSSDVHELLSDDGCTIAHLHGQEQQVAVAQRHALSCPGA